jgi:hypothetical protein
LYLRVNCGQFARSQKESNPGETNDVRQGRTHGHRFPSPGKIAFDEAPAPRQVHDGVRRKHSLTRRRYLYRLCRARQRRGSRRLHRPFQRLTYGDLRRRRFGWPHVQYLWSLQGHVFYTIFGGTDFTTAGFNLAAVSFAASPLSSGTFLPIAATEGFTYAASDGDALSGTVSWTSLAVGPEVASRLSAQLTGELTVDTSVGDSDFLNDFSVGSTADTVAYFVPPCPIDTLAAGGCGVTSEGGSFDGGPPLRRRARRRWRTLPSEDKEIRRRRSWFTSARWLGILPRKASTPAPISAREEEATAR